MYLRNLYYFIIGGLILVSINYLTLFVDSKLAALVWSLPILSLPSYIIIYQETKKRDLIFTLNSEIIAFFFVNLTFFISLYTTLKYTNFSFYNSVLLSMISYSLFAFLVYKLL